MLARRSIADGVCAFFATWCPAGTGLDTLVAVEGQRWAIEDSFETAKTEFGLDHNESRSWHGWHRHVSLVMLAFAIMRTGRLLRKPRAARLMRAKPYPLVAPGDPSRRHAPRATTHSPGLYQPPFVMTGPARLAVPEVLMMVEAESGHHKGQLVLHHRLVALAASAPSRRPTLTSETI